MISSTGNAQIKQAAALVKKAKYRRETGLFVVERTKNVLRTSKGPDSYCICVRKFF